MKKVLVVVALGVVAFLVGPAVWEKGAVFKGEREAVERVEDMLRSEREGDEQRAVSRYARGMILANHDVLVEFTPKFTAFVQRTGIDRHDAWSVEPVSVEAGGDVVHLRLTAGGETLRLRVPRGEVIEIE